MAVRDRIVELRRVPASDLRASRNNWRRHPAHQAKALAAVLEQVGYAGALIARETPEGLELIDGHLRAETTPDQEVPVLVLDVDEDEAALILATLDPLAAMAETDQDALFRLLEAVEIPDDDLARVLEGLTGQAVPVGLTDPDDVPPPPAKPKTKLGDLWLLGEHRLLCGDSFDEAALDRLLDGVTPGCVLTDPPYGINLDTDYSSITGSKNSMLRKQGRKLVDANTYRRIEGDTQSFDAAPFRTRFTCTEQFWFGANYYRRTLSVSDRDGSWLVWDKRPSGWNDDGKGIDDVIGSGFELVWSAARHQQRVLRQQWSGFTARNPGVERAHPTEKPVALLADILSRWAPEACVVVDPFAGSGTTLIAAEQTDRTCYAMEIDPAYCDVIVKRWEDFTGKKAERAKAAA